MVELMIVVSIIGLLAVIAIPAFTQSRMISQNAAFMNDIRRLSGDVFDLYALDNGDLPPDAPAANQPAGIATYMPKQFSFTDGTPIGGVYDWDRGATRSDKVHGGLCYGGLAIVGPGRTASQMTDIDADIDDGDLNTGIFQSVGGGDYVLIVEP